MSVQRCFPAEISIFSYSRGLAQQILNWVLHESPFSTYQFRISSFSACLDVLLLAFVLSSLRDDNLASACPFLDDLHLTVRLTLSASVISYTYFIYIFQIWYYLYCCLIGSKLFLPEFCRNFCHLRTVCRLRALLLSCSVFVYAIIFWRSLIAPFWSAFTFRFFHCDAGLFLQNTHSAASLSGDIDDRRLVVLYRCNNKL
ncbi:hypothetical protein BZA70DRAFT_166496 [Myxozyma melibiosi]|uniref:Uncharacterized protein n=1 Tax=Myxozyma melibiosi TaxID=54550 RepID=A0ABR1F737_9ASCO